MYKFYFSGGIISDMDNVLARKLLESLIVNDVYAQKSRVPDSMSYTVATNLKTTAPEVKDFYLSMSKKGYSAQEIIDIVKAMEEPLNQEIAEHLKGLLRERRVSTSSFGEKSFLSDGYVRQVLSGKKSLSKETLFGLCLYLELSKSEVDKFLSVYGLELGKSIEDVMFKTYIDKGIYKLCDYVEDCVRLANAADLKLPKFYYKEYTNETYKTA